MLRTGVDAGEAGEQVRTLVGIEDDPESGEMIGSGSHGGAARSELGASEVSPTRVPASDSVCVRTDDPPLRLDEVDDRLDEAHQLNRRHWKEAGRPISAETLRQRPHISASASRDLTRAVRAADRAAILEEDP